MKASPKTETAAARWLALRDQGLPAEQEREFQLWLNTDPRNAGIFAEMDRAWRLLDRAAEAPAAHALEKELASLPRQPGSLLHWFPGALAAAAAAVVAALVLFHPWRSVPPVSAPESAGRPMVRYVDLPDGSVMELKAGAVAEPHFTTAVRAVTLLAGEAHFSVVKNPERPFVVRAGQVSVRAVGTGFDVRLGGREVDVIVTEGRVRVDQAGDDPHRAALVPLLAAGQRASLEAAVPRARPPVVTALAKPAIDQELAWRDHWLEFTSSPLAEIVAEFNRCNRTKIAIPDAELGRRAFGGVFKANDPEAFARLLQATFGVTVERQEYQLVLRDRE